MEAEGLRYSIHEARAETRAGDKRKEKPRNKALIDNEGRRLF